MSSPVSFSKPDAALVLIVGILAGTVLTLRHVRPDVALALVLPAAIAWGFLSPAIDRRHRW